MAYPMNALDWYRKNRSGLVGFGGFNGFGDDASIEARRQVANSEWWDANWYKQRYPDVAAAGADPLAHFIVHGGMPGERRDPQINFSTSCYFDLNPDVAAANVNALLHYLRHGRGEGRAIYGVDSPCPRPPPPPPPPPPGPTPEEIRQRDAEEQARLSKIEADRQKALADKAQEDKLQADRDAAKAKLDADQALIDASRNAADLQRQIAAQQALDELAAADAKKAAADLAAAKAEAAAYEASLKAEQAKGSATSTVLTGQDLAPPSTTAPSSGPSPLLYVGLAALGALLLLKKKG